MQENKNQKKKVMILVLVLGLVLLTIGGTYAFFTYSKEGVKLNTLTTGTMYFVYDELPNQDGNQISISNAFPMTDDKGKNQEQPGMFEFQVRATTQGAPIYYEVYLTNESESLELDALPEKVVKTYLTDASNGNEEPINNHWTSKDVNLFNELWVSQVPPVKDNLNGRTLLQDVVNNNVQDYEKTYRYRMWLDDNANKVNKDGEWVYGNKVFSVHVNVYASNEKLPDPIPPRATLRAWAQKHCYDDHCYSEPIENVDFHDEQYKSKITSISFVKPSEVPNETDANWDITANPDDAGKVTAYLVKNQPLEKEETYSVYITSNTKTIYLNEDSSYLFGGDYYSFDKLEEIKGLEILDTSEVTDMSGMFYDCSQLQSLDLSGWDTSNVTKMMGIFKGCSQLTDVGDLSGWDTSSVTDMGGLFSDCELLSNLDFIQTWDVSNVLNMDSIFSGCVSIEELDLSTWHTMSLISMNSMFNGCSGLTSLNINNWDISKAIYMESIFDGCSSLTNLDLSDWDIRHVTNMQWMFHNCSQLTTIFVKDYDTKQWIVDNASEMKLDNPEQVVQVKTQ